MSAVRWEHAATLLPNGKVLVAGSVLSDGDNLASAELYDLAIGAWSPTGSMNVGRSSFTLTLLANGAALAAGGFLGGSGLAFDSAELYDPITGAWSLTSSMHVAHTLHTATLLTDGTVLVAGGNSSVGLDADILAEAERFTPPDAATQLGGAIGLVNSFALATGLQTSLDAKLQAARDAVRAGDTTTACHTLNAFANEVRAQSGRGLTIGQASELLAEVMRLEAMLGC